MLSIHFPTLLAAGRCGCTSITLCFLFYLFGTDKIEEVSNHGWELFPYTDCSGEFGVLKGVGSGGGSTQLIILVLMG